MIGENSDSSVGAGSLADSVVGAHAPLAVTVVTLDPNNQSLRNERTTFRNSSSWS
jgi:hypothetical protein